MIHTLKSKALKRLPDFQFCHCLKIREVYSQHNKGPEGPVEGDLEGKRLKWVEEKYSRSFLTEIIRARKILSIHISTRLSFLNSFVCGTRNEENEKRNASGHLVPLLTR